MSVVLGEKEFFKGIEKVKFEGQGSGSFERKKNIIHNKIKGILIA